MVFLLGKHFLFARTEKRKKGFIEMKILPKNTLKESSLHLRKLQHLHLFCKFTDDKSLQVMVLCFLTTQGRVRKCEFILSFLNYLKTKYFALNS